jgi:hypothetical protein
MNGATHRELVTSHNPGCFVVLLDRSDSMKQSWAGTQGTLAQGAAQVLNSILIDLCFIATKDIDAPMKHYFDVGIISYGARLTTPGEGVESAFGGALTGRWLVPLPELANNPLAMREEQSIDDVTESSTMPVWVEPVHGYRTPMCEAIAVAGQHIYDWTHKHPCSFPPIVVNITDGMKTDDGYKGLSLLEWARRLTGITTDDGPTLLFNVFLSPDRAPEQLFPASPAGLPRPGPELFEMSSTLPQQMVDNARADGVDVRPGGRALAFNVGRSSLLRVLQIGTRVKTG